MLNFTQNTFQNFDILSVGVVVIATVLLGFIVFFSNSKSVTHRTFLLFSLATGLWGIINYLSYQIFPPEISFWFLRLTVFFAVLHAFLFFQFSYVFPKETFEFSKLYRIGFVPAIIIFALLTLTPFVFSGILELSANGRIIKIANGPGVALFVIIVLFLITGGIYFLIKKMARARDKEKKQLRSILIGTGATFLLLIAFNLVLPVFFDNPSFVPLGAIFIFPFVVFTFYAIARQGFMDIKIISTTIVVFLLTLTTFLEALTVESIDAYILRLTVVALMILFGVFLIQSLSKEVLQKEQLELLSESLVVANEELKKLDEQKSDFITIASHQLRTPLTIIKGYISLVLEKDYGAYPQEIAEPLQRINTSNNRLINLVNDLLDLSRIERGKMTYVFQTASLAPIVDEVFNEMAEMAKEKKLELHYEKPEGEFRFSSIDPKKIKEVMMGFVENAIRYTPEGLITMKLLHDKNKRVVRFSVADMGIGLTQDEINRLFVKFSRMDSAKRISSEGTGLGLYVAKLIVEDHKGKIWVESEGHGKGSVFIFELPTVV
ncbi:MAG: ATP-binding protein [Patescibacteria group bacterium]